MAEKHRSPRILFPRSVAEALELKHREPEAAFWAGGTRLGYGGSATAVLDLPKAVISLGLVDELTRAARSEHSLEIGSMMTLDRLESIGRSALPAGLPDALAGIGSRPLRCRATIGGHIAVGRPIGDLRPLLQLLETTVETRYLKSRSGRRKAVSVGRKLPIGRLHSDDGLRPDELIVRVIIPTETWNHAVFIKEPPLVFTALARIEKGLLAEWRMAFRDESGPVRRNRDLEVDMAGRPLPVDSRSIGILEQTLDRMTEKWTDREDRRAVVRRLAVGFLTDCGTATW